MPLCCTANTDTHLSFIATDSLTPAAIEATNPTKRFGETTVVDGIDLAVPTGTVYGFLGSNGAGKTAMMRMLTSLTLPTTGEASVAETPITDRGALRARIGYLPEEPPVFDELIGSEQLRYFARLRNVPPKRGDRPDRRLVAPVPSAI